MNRRPVNRRLILFSATVAVVAAVLWAARGAILPFVIGLVVAYLLAPVVRRVHHAIPRRWRDHRAARPVAILAVYLTAIALVVLAAALIVPPVVRQGQDLLRGFPGLAAAWQDRLQRYVDENRQYWPPQSEAIIDQALHSDATQRLAVTSLGYLQRAGLATVGAVSNTVSFLLAFLIVPIWLVYVLDNTDRVIHGALGVVPHDIRADVEAVRVICDRVLGAYVRGQLFVAVMLGLMFTVALTLLKVPYSLLLGVTGGLLALIPFVGSILGMVPAVLVASFESARLALLVVLAFIGIQQIDNLFISPRVQGRSVALHPALVMVVLVIGQQILGILGMLAAVPITAILRDVVHYFYVRVGEDRPTPFESLKAVGYASNATPLILATRPAPDTREVFE